MSKEFRIGLIALISGAILYYGFNYLKGIEFFSKSSYYYVIYGNVDGLTKSNPVVVNGLTVGKVNDIKLLQNRENKILVELSIDDEVQLGDSTIAELKDSDILGGKEIELNIGEVKTPLEAGDTLIPGVDPGLAKYLDDVQPITTNLSITISRINEILLGLQGSGEKINSTIGELNITLRQVNDVIRTNKEELANTLVTTRRLIENLNDRVSQFDPILAKGDQLMDSLNNLNLNETITSANNLLDQMTELLLEIDNGEGTLGKLANNDSLYNNLNQLLVDLDKLVIHFDQYPKDFMKPLGRKHKKLQGVEQDN